MQNLETIEQNRIINRTLAIGFLIFSAIVACFFKIDGILFIAILSLIVGYAIALLWKKLDPITNADFSNHRDITSAKDDLIM